jgi:hypothetical protein
MMKKAHAVCPTGIDERSGDGTEDAGDDLGGDVARACRVRGRVVRRQ